MRLGAEQPDWTRPPAIRSPARNRQNADLHPFISYFTTSDHERRGNLVIPMRVW